MIRFQYAKEHILAAGKPVALIDVDGVMQNNHHRLHHICEDVSGVQKKLKKPDWDAFEARAHEDTPGVFASLVQGLSHAFMPVYLTARVDREKGNHVQLAAELRRISGVAYAPLLMRPLASLAARDSATDFKREVVEVMRASGIQIAMAVDDSHANCKMFAGYDIPTLRLYNHLTPTMYHY